MSKLTHQSNFNSAVLGQYGAICVRGTDSVTPPLGMVFCAVTALDNLTLSKALSYRLDAMDQRGHELSTNSGDSNKLTIDGTTVGPFVVFDESTGELSPGDVAYTVSNDAILAVVKSVGVGEDGSANDNAIEFDRVSAYSDGAVVGFRSKDRGYSATTDRLSSAVIPKGGYNLRIMDSFAVSCR
jgi:hypothetical protein